MSHPVKYVTVAIDNVLDFLFPPRDFTRSLAYKMHSVEHAVALPIFNTCVRLGLAKKQTEIDSHTELLAQMLWQEAEARGIKVWEFRLFGLPRNIFVAEFPNGEAISYEGTPVPPRSVYQAWWLDDKAVLKKQFQRIGLPVANGGVVFTKKGALQLFSRLNKPVIIKPRNGSGSRHTTLHITDEKELLQAFNVATQISPAAIIEEELTGAVYRATVVDGKLSATLRRDQPYVIGDGESTIHELVNEANRHPARSDLYPKK